MRAWTVVMVLVALAGGRCVHAGPAEDTLEALFGAQLREAAKGSPKEKVELAAKLLEAARQLKDAPEVRVLLYEKAAELAAARVEGFGLATEALDKLAAAAPARREACGQKALELAERQMQASAGEARKTAAAGVVARYEELAEARLATGKYDEAQGLYRRAGPAAAVAGAEARNALEARMLAAGERQRLARKREALEARLQAGPADATARQDLVALLLFELERPGDAVAPASGDATLKQMVELAAKPPETLNEAEALELAGWLAAQAVRPGLSAAGRISAYRQARARLEQYLATHGKDDVPRLKAKLTWEQLGKDLARLEGEGKRGSDWLDLLKMLDPARLATAATWTLKDGKLSNTGTGVALVQLPVQVQGSYELEVRCTRVAGAGGLLVVFPAGAASNLLLPVDYFGKSGFGAIDGKAWNQNPTTTAGPKLDSQREHLVRLKVQAEGPKVTVQVELDGLPIIRWAGAGASLGPQGGAWTVPTPSGLGLGSHQAMLTIRSARLRMLDGQAKPLAEAAAPPGK